MSITSRIITLSSDITNLNFTNKLIPLKTFNISGYKNDTAGNVLSGWNITLYNATTSSFIAFNLTDANGFYEFQNLAPGNYNVTEVLKNGWMNVTPSSRIITLSSDITNLNFTNKLTTFNTFNISGYKSDTSGNVLSGWNITLYDATTSSFIAFNLTDAHGFYEFQNLAPGNYNVT